MKTCPAPETLRRLLAEDLPTGEAALLRDHVESCTACQALLEQWTATQLPLEATTSRPLNAPHLQFLQLLMEQRPTLGHPRAEYPEKAGPTAILHPAPPSIENYEILGVLGQGGMSVVYRARQQNLNRLVALKVLAKPEADTKELARFRAEARALAALRHPHIVPVYEVGEQEDQPYFTMELIEGGSLAQRLRGQPQDPFAAAKLVETLAAAMHYAHEQGIVHRDLKPANILLQEAGDRDQETGKNTRLVNDSRLLTHSSWTPKIADFGLAKYLHQTSGRTQSGAILGTPSYMAPEQAVGDVAAVGPSADVYALGAVLYELLTGRPPFQGATPLATLNTLVHEEPVTPSLLVPAVPQDLATICLKCLEKEVAQRYASARELSEDLERFLTHQPIQARPSSVLYRWGKFARRNRGVVGGMLGILAALMAGTVVAVILAVGERQARNRADRNAERADRNAEHALLEAARARLASTVHALAGFEYEEAEQDLDSVPNNLRGWEWRHLHNRLMGERPTVLHLAPEYHAVQALLPTGRRLVVQHANSGRLCLLDAHTGILVRELPPGTITGIAQSGAGAVLMLATPNQPLLLINEAGMPESTPVVMGKSPGPTALSADGEILAGVRTIDAGEIKVELWERRTGKVRRALSAKAPLLHLAFSSDGALLAGAGTDLTITLWDTATGKITAVCRGHQRTIRGIAFGGKETPLLSWSEDGTLRRWRLPNGEPVGTMRGHSRIVSGANYSLRDAYIFSISADNTVRLWRGANGEALAVLPTHDETAFWLALEPGDAAILTANAVGALLRWPLTMLADPYTLRGHSSYVYPVAYSPDGRWIASGGWDNVIRIWDANSGKQLRVLQGPTSFISCLAVSPDGTRLVARSMDGRLRIWDMRDGALLHNLEDGGLEDYRPPESPSYRVPCFAPQNVAVSPDGTLVACGFKNQIRFWDLATGREQNRLTAAIKDAIRHVVFSPNGRYLAIAATEPGLCLIDRATGAIERTFAGPKGPVYAVAFSPDGRNLAGAGEDRVIRLWDWTTGELQKELRGHTDQVFTLAFHPDGSRIASGGRDHFIILWDPITGDGMARLQGHADYVFSLAFHPDGSALVSGSGDSTVRIWDTVPLAQRRASQ